MFQLSAFSLLWRLHTSLKLRVSLLLPCRVQNWNSQLFTPDYFFYKKGTGKYEYIKSGYRFCECASSSDGVKIWIKWQELQRVNLVFSKNGTIVRLDLRRCYRTLAFAKVRWVVLDFRCAKWVQVGLYACTYFFKGFSLYEKPLWASAEERGYRRQCVIALTTRVTKKNWSESCPHIL